MFKTPKHILQKIERCREKQEKRLDLRESHLLEIPPEVFTLTHLEEIDLRKNAIQIVSSEIKQLKSLKFIDLRYNPLRQVADVFGLFIHYVDFQNLHLSPANIIGLKFTLFSYDLPVHFEDFPNLIALDISHHRFKTLPHWVLSLTHLTFLDLSHNEIKNLEGIEKLSNLSSLDLSYNQLSRLEGIEKLSNLSSLYLSWNGLSNLEGIEKLFNLSSLDLSINQLSNLEGIEKLSNLSSLDLRNNQLSSLEGIEKLFNLSSLDLGENKLSSLEGIEKLSNLSSLDLGGNKLSSLEGIEKLSNLSSLYLGDNQLSGLEGIEKLSNLSSLDLGGNKLSSLEGIEKLSNLSSLYLSYNKLSSLEGIGKLSNLSSLYLSYNKLSSLEGIEKLSNLSSLDLSYNKLSSLEGIEKLSNLSSLYLSGNKLSSLEGIEKLSNLSLLSLRNNKLSSLEGIEKLSNLSPLYLSGNQLSNLQGIEKLSNLSSLYLMNNQFKKLPTELLNLPKLESLDIENNTIQNIPLEELDLENGMVNLLRVRNYLRQLAEEKDYLYEAKLLIIGEGEAGKTSLANKIQNPTYQLPPEGIPSTHGIEVKQWTFPYDDKYRYRVNIWDFGGQEILHATHQFFLSKRALYLLVADNRKEDTDFYYWLNVAELFSDNSPLFIIKNEKQNIERNINETALKSQFSAFLKDIYATNLKENSKDFNKLLDNIQTTLKHLPHIGQALPKKWLNVRETLEKNPHNYISLETFFQICEQHGFKNKGDKLHLSQTLHDLGTILHFQEDDLLKKTVILKPEWGTQAVYRVLYDENVKQTGKFTKQQVKQIWFENQYEMMESELLQLMVKFKLCYPLNDCPDTYIVPQLLPDNQPDFKWNAENNLKVYFTYEFMPKGIITQLIVALHQFIANHQKCVWKSGVIFEKENTKAKVIEYYGARKLEIHLVGANKRDLMTILKHELDKIHASFKQLKYKAMLPCSCKEFQDNPAFFDYNKLHQFSSKNKLLQCENADCDKMLNARDLIDGVWNEKNFEEQKNFGRNSSNDPEEIAQEKLSYLEKALLLETDSATKFNLEHQIADLKERINQLNALF